MLRSRRGLPRSESPLPRGYRSGGRGREAPFEPDPQSGPQGRTQIPPQQFGPVVQKRPCGHSLLEVQS